MLWFKRQKPGLKAQKKKEMPDLQKGKVKVKISGHEVIIDTGSLTAVFDKKTGAFTSLKFGGLEILERGLRINLWRSPTDNDAGGGVNSFGSQWSSSGLDQPGFTVKKIDVFEQDKSAGIDLKGVLSSKSGDIEVNTIYIIHGNGDIHISNNINIPESIKTVPRIGTEWLLKVQFNHVKWYGRGPHENYIDRKEGARFGVYESLVKDLYFPYVKPQENGNRSDVFWLTIKNNKNIGLLVKGDPTFEFSATHYSLENLTKARHTTDIEDAPFTTLNIDLRQAGLGGDNSWAPRTHPEYQLRSGKYSFSYIIRPVDFSKTTIRDLVE